MRHQRVQPLAGARASMSRRAGRRSHRQRIAFGELTLTRRRETIVDVVTFPARRSGMPVHLFIDVCGVDFPERDERFDVVYHLMSPTRTTAFASSCTPTTTRLCPSITQCFRGADWFEREAYDLYGMLFSGHPDLRRILTDYGFDGHPLRKDFPLTGFVEVRYDEERKRVVYEPVKLMQEFRSFDYLSPWEGTDYVLPGDEKAKQ